MVVYSKKYSSYSSNLGNVMLNELKQNKWNYICITRRNSYV